MKSSTFLTAGEAAKATGKSSSTISRAIKKGKIGGVSRGSNGQYEIDPAALFAVFPPVQESDDAHHHATAKRTATHHHAPPPENAGYEEAIKALKATISSNEKLIETQEKMLSDYQIRLAKSENLLTDQSEKLEKAEEKMKQAEAPEPEKKGFFRRLFG